MSDNRNAALEFTVVPEKCLRNEHIELALGTPINQVLSLLKAASRVIRNVDLVYCNKEPFKRDITILLKNENIRLTFEAKSQLLNFIEVFNFDNIVLQYDNNTFCRPTELADISKVQTAFGWCTHPGVYEVEKQTFSLTWNGVSFCFPAKEPSKLEQPTHAHGLGTLNFSNSVNLERMFIFCGEKPSVWRLPPIPTSVYCGNLFPQKIESVHNENEISGLRIICSGEDLASSPRKKADVKQREIIILFGDSEQSVLSVLGAPSRVFYKSDDKMLIQRGPNSEHFENGNADRPDMFYNYFTLGLDILVDAEKRCVKKFVLRTNLPGHFDFGEYFRAPFSVKYPLRSDIFPDEYCVIESDSKLEDVRNAFSDAETGICKPVVVNRAPVGEAGGENPFGSTFCYGNNQLIIEVMDNSHIGTLTIFKPILHPTLRQQSSESPSADESS